MENIVLIGMPGCGKSTVGVLVAKALNLDFIDTDILLQRKTGMLLSDILAKGNNEEFIKIENEILCSIDVERTVIATGGSSVFCVEGMEHLTKNGTVIFIDEDLSVLNERIPELVERGIVHEEDESLEEIYNKRRPYYEKFAEITVKSSGHNISEVKMEIIRKFRLYAEKNKKL